MTFIELAVCELSRFSTTTFINFALGVSSTVLFTVFPGLSIDIEAVQVYVVVVYSVIA